MLKAEKRNCPLVVRVNIGRAKLYRTCGIFENFLKVRRQKVLGTCGRSIKVQKDFFVWTLGQVRKNKQGSRVVSPGGGGVTEGDRGVDRQKDPLQNAIL